MTTAKRVKNLTEGPILPLILKFSIPTALTLMVNTMYNIVDQIFIGQSVGLLGNAATNAAFPLSSKTECHIFSSTQFFIFSPLFTVAPLRASDGTE